MANALGQGYYVVMDVGNNDKMIAREFSAQKGDVRNSIKFNGPLAVVEGQLNLNTLSINQHQYSVLGNLTSADMREVVDRIYALSEDMTGERFAEWEQQISQEAQPIPYIDMAPGSQKRTFDSILEEMEFDLSEPWGR